MVTSLTKSEVTASAKSTLHLQARMETEANYYLKKKKKKGLLIINTNNTVPVIKNRTFNNSKVKIMLVKKFFQAVKWILQKPVIKFIFKFPERA